MPKGYFNTLIDLTGMRFGRLTVVAKTDRRVRGTYFWRCQCDCGRTHDVAGDDLKRGGTQSCGCLRAELNRKKLPHAIKHGMARKRNAAKIYGIWCTMHSRCGNPNVPSFKDYGGRGIKVCDRWLKFENFYADMGDRPEGRTLDRIDNDGDYEPANCRWATWVEQRANRRPTRRRPS